MKFAREFVTSTVVGGVFIVVPVYLAIVLLLKGMQSAAKPGAAVRRAAARLAAGRRVLLPAPRAGRLLRRRCGGAHPGRAGRFESDGARVLRTAAGYGLLRSLTQRLAGDGRRARGSRRSSRSRTRSSPASSSKSWRTAGSRSSCRRSRRRLPEPSTSSPGTRACRRRAFHAGDSDRSPDGGRGRRTSWPRCESAAPATWHAGRCGRVGPRAARGDERARQRP